MPTSLLSLDTAHTHTDTHTHTHTHTQWEQGQGPTSVNSSFCHFTTSHCVHMSHDKSQNKVEPIICLPNKVEVSINLVLEYNLEMEII